MRRGGKKGDSDLRIHYNFRLKLVIRYDANTRNLSITVPIMDLIDQVLGLAFAIDAFAISRSGVPDEQSDFRTLRPRAPTIALCWANRRRAIQTPFDT